jgi:hypothetical protein
MLDLIWFYKVVKILHLKGSILCISMILEINMESDTEVMGSKD